MKHRLKRTWLTAAWAATTVLGAGTALAQDDSAALLARLKQLQPATRFDSVRPSAVPGLYEVAMGRNVAYVEPSGRYWVFGHVWDMQSQSDLTETRVADLDRVDFSQLPTDLAIRFVNGRPTRSLAIFADPNCGYCRLIEKDLAQLKDTAIYVYPVAILGQDSAAKVQAIWCSTDRAAAWREWMTKAAQPVAAAAKSAKCAAPIEQLMQLAKTARVEGTPTFVAADGRKRSGARSVAELSAWLDNTAARSSGQSGQSGQSVSIKSTKE